MAKQVLISDPQARAGMGRQRMPAGVRRVLLTGVAVLMAGALYLIAVRGEALLVDLSQLSQAVIACF
ncbi:MAG TPA: hypothetical protein VFY92_03290 [Hyphomicrobiaceae bacterium]|nr:hypothetical protein [Hyphomicrobiaceae bacterium]